MATRFRPSLLLFRLRRLLQTFWFLPLLVGFSGPPLAAFIFWIEDLAAFHSLIRYDLFQLNEESARAVLSVVAGATISAASIVYSLSLLVRTVATGTLGPRLVQAFGQDPIGRVALGMQLAVFLYCLAILYLVGGQIERRTLSVAVAILIGIGALVTLVLFVHSVASAVNVDNTVAKVASSLRTSVAEARKIADDGDTDQSAPPVADDACVVRATASGYVQTIDRSALATDARRLGLTLVLAVRPGDFMLVGAEAMRALGADTLSEDDARRLLRHVVLGSSRTGTDDPRFSLQLLVEIALRALSSGVNDVYTAIACADHLSAIMASLAGRNLTPGAVCDRDGVARVFSRALDFQDLADAVYHPLRQSGASNPVLALGLLRRLADVIPMIADEKARAVLRGHASLIAEDASEQATNEADRRAIEELYRAVRDEAHHRRREESGSVAKAGA